MSGAPRCVLVISDDAASLATFSDTSNTLGLETACARTQPDALAAARSSRFCLVVLDRDFSNGWDGELIRQVRGLGGHLPVVILSRRVTASMTRDALHVGALGVLGKPVDRSDVIAALRAASDLSRGPHPTRAAAARIELSGTAVRQEPRSIAERWAMMVLKTIEADADPKTIGTWARAMGISRSALRECCRLVHVTAHNTRDFARVMRAIALSGPEWEPEMVLDLADARTLKKLLTRAGLPPGGTVTPSTYAFLESQRWVPGDNPGLIALRRLLALDDQLQRD